MRAPLDKHFCVLPSGMSGITRRLRRTTEERSASGEEVRGRSQRQACCCTSRMANSERFTTKENTQGWRDGGGGNTGFGGSEAEQQ